jgi:hypothetical protein
MKIPEEHSVESGPSRQNALSGGAPRSELASIMAGLERQKEELGPIADELIDLFRYLGVDMPPPPLVNPSSE